MNSEVEIRHRQFERATEGPDKDRAASALREKEEEYVAQSEAYRSNLELRARGPRANLEAGTESPELEGLLLLLAEAEPLNRSLLDSTDLFIRGNVLLEAGRLAEAVGAYEDSLDLDPGEPAVLNNMAIALIRLRRFAEAEKAARRSLSVGGETTTAAKTTLALALNSLGRYDEALVLSDQVLAEDPSQPFALTQKANALRNLGRFDEALALLEAGPRSSDALHQMAAIKRETGRIEAALADTIEAIEARESEHVFINLDIGHIWLDRAKLESMLGRHSAAIQSARTAVELDGGRPESVLVLGLELAHEDELDEALRVLRAVHAEEPIDSSVVRAIAQILMELDEYEEAAVFQDLAISLEPRDPVLLANRGRIAEQLGELDAAESFVRRALSESPDDVQALLAAYRIFQGQGKVEDAEATLATIAALDPKSEIPVIERANRALTAADLDEAEALLAPLLLTSEPSLEARYAQACILSRKRRLEDAAEVLRSVLADDPTRARWAAQDPDLENLRRNATLWRRTLASTTQPGKGCRSTPRPRSAEGGK